MNEQESIYDPAVADGRFQLEVLGVRWVLVFLYALFVGLGVIEVDVAWFIASEGFLIAFHVYYTWYVWRELGPNPLPPATAYATPFLDTGAVSLALIAVGDPLHPIWAVYFFIMVGVTFFYYPIARVYGVWLIVCYGMVGLGLQSRGVDVPAPMMGVAAIILLAGIINLTTYAGGERRLRGRISEVARTDPLTGLLNRRGLEEILSPESEEQDVLKQAFAVFMLDVDRFKRFNDQFGHLSADKVLEHLANILKAAVRNPDLVARYGGDEFVIIVPDVTADEAVQLAERLREQVARLGLCTVSIGVTFSDRRDISAKNILDLADTALLEAKQAGRNCVRA
ncbi:MAG: GGDEF domain-containing protein, partial [Chloroflexi bacterium]|nr:GGDEF domain-containing protein [Chloroflexota bacterium]